MPVSKEVIRYNGGKVLPLSPAIPTTYHLRPLRAPLHLPPTAVGGTSTYHLPPTEPRAKLGWPGGRRLLFTGSLGKKDSHSLALAALAILVILRELAALALILRELAALALILRNITQSYLRTLAPNQCHVS